MSDVADCGAFHAFTAYRHPFCTLLHLLKGITGMDEWTDRVSLVHERVSVTAVELKPLLPAHTLPDILHGVLFFWLFSFQFHMEPQNCWRSCDGSQGCLVPEAETGKKLTIRQVNR